MPLSSTDIKEFLDAYTALIEAVAGVKPQGAESWADARDVLLAK